MADRMVFFKLMLLSGAANALDGIDGTDRGDGNPLQDLDLAFTVDTSILYVHQLDADSAAAESSPDVVKPDTNAGDKRWILLAKVEDISAYVAKSAYDAFTILYADSDNTPLPLTVGASTIVGRKSTGGIVALTKAEVLAIINVADGANVGLTDIVNDTTPQLGGNLDLNGKAISTTTPTADTWEGPVRTLTAHENVTLGQLCYMNTDGEAALTDADAAATMPGWCIATGTINANNSGVFLLPSALSTIHLHALAPGWTVGSLVYAGSGAGPHTAGALNQTPPAGDSDVVQIVGVALAADILLFMPSLVTVEAHA
jgi:hypothetical protein